MAQMEHLYSKMPPIRQDWDSYESFRRQLLFLDNSSSPGWPYMREKTTIGSWLGADGLGNFDEMQVQRLWYDTQQVMQGKYRHLFRAFVKDEPHKKAKKLASKWRLIVAASLPVQMAWRLAFAEQNDWLNDNAYSTPSAHGLVFSSGGWKRFKAHCLTKKLKVSRDLSAWDINAPGWVLEAVKQLRIRLGGPNPPRTWIDCVERLYYDAFSNAHVLFSNGAILRQLFEGFMKSGLFNTISDNSLAQGFMHLIACLRTMAGLVPWWATGDDVIHGEVPPQYVEQLELLGCKVKEIEEKLVFMGTDFTNDDGPVPVYFSKHIVKVCTAMDEETRAQTLDAFARLYCHDEKKWLLWASIASKFSVNLRSRSYYRFWYDSPFARLLK